MEVWNDVKGYEGLYQISNLGRVKSLRRNKVMKTTINRDGYEVISFSVNLKRKFFQIHRLVLQTFIPLNTFMESNHKNGIKSDNKLSNLEWINRSDNQIHAFQTGLQKRKLSITDVKRIKHLYSRNELTHKSIARIYNISRTMITRILNGTRYKDCI